LSLFVEKVIVDRIAIVVPVFNESVVLPASLPRILAVAQSSGCSILLIAVDDGSHDETWAVLGQLAETYPELLPIAFTRNFGKEAAILAGLRAAIQDPQVQAIVVMDADLQHPPELLSQFIDHWRGGALVVEGVRDEQAYRGFFRNLGAQVFYFLMARFGQLRMSGSTDYKLIDRRVANQLLSLGERARFFRGLVLWLGYPRIQVPFTVAPRLGGQSQWGLLSLTRYAWENLTAFSSAPLKLVTVLGVIGLAVGTLLAAKALIDKFFGISVDGFSTVILLSIIFSSLILVALGIIGSYLARIYEEIKSRPVYILRDSIADPVASCPSDLSDRGKPADK
jgi:dolichol-phosphate mannosyltransferase